MIEPLLYIATGIFAGLMSGILGIGGGVIVVPALLFIYSQNAVVAPELAMHVAAGTSLAIMVFTSQSSIIAHHRLGGIEWPLYAKLIKGVIIGTIIGGLLSNRIPTEWLKIILGFFLLFIAIKMALPKKTALGVKFPRPIIHHLISFLIGFKSGLLGIGGGALIVPYLNYCGIERRRITGISSLCTLTVASIGTVVFILSGWGNPGLPRGSSGYVYWFSVLWVALPSVLFAPLGARLMYKLSLPLLNYFFITVLLFTAINLII